MAVFYRRRKRDSSAQSKALRDFGGKQFPESFSFAETLPGSNP